MDHAPRVLGTIESCPKTAEVRTLSVRTNIVEQRGNVTINRSFDFSFFLLFPFSCLFYYVHMYVCACVRSLLFFLIFIRRETTIVATTTTTTSRRDESFERDFFSSTFTYFVINVSQERIAGALGFMENLHFLGLIVEEKPEYQNIAIDCQTRSRSNGLLFWCSVPTKVIY